MARVPSTPAPTSVEEGGVKEESRYPNWVHKVQPAPVEESVDSESCNRAAPSSSGRYSAPSRPSPQILELPPPSESYSPSEFAEFRQFRSNNMSSNGGDSDVKRRDKLRGAGHASSSKEERCDLLKGDEETGEASSYILTLKTNGGTLKRACNAAKKKIAALFCSTP